MMNAELVPRILIVEDETGMREGIHRILTKRGLQACMAAGGEEAVRMIEADEYPVVLVDLKMPGMDGFELIERINRMKPGTVCVVVSALATVGTIVKTTQMGTFDFIVKPFVPDELMMVVNRAVEKWRLTRETARLRAEREGHLLQLSAEKSRLKTIMQSMGDGLLVVNIDNNVVLDNDAARSLLRWVDGPSSCVPVSEVLPDPNVCNQIRELLLCRQNRQVKIEMSVPPRSEREAISYLKVTLAPFQDENGAVLGVVVLLSDISDTKAYERMKTMFISMVAHEVKAPIGAIQSYLNIIEDGLLDHDVAQIKGIAARCLDRSNALLSLVQDLLELTRQEAIQEKRLIEPVDVRAVTSKLVEFHRTQAMERGIRIELCFADKLPLLQADTSDVERMLTNLLSNAIKYNRDSGTIWVRLESNAAALKIEVEDTGIGMKPEDVRRIGEEFFRAKNEKTRAITGTGLGLALVKRIVKSCHGSLEIESQPDRGSRFRVLLPLGGNQEQAVSKSL
jgi:signal transduction histidine kinase/FixJ family two-component response regulator